jgi:5-methylcytosine-specific restriction enzyme A
MRDAVLRTQPACQRCHEAPATTVHHVVAHRGDPHLFWNGALQAVCSSCHSRIASDK